MDIDVANPRNSKVRSGNNSEAHKTMLTNKTCPISSPRNNRGDVHLEWFLIAIAGWLAATYLVGVLPGIKTMTDDTYKSLAKDGTVPE